MVSTDAGTGVAARVGAAGAPGAGVGAGAVVGAGVGGVAAARAIGAPIGDLRDAVFVREAGAWAVVRWRGAPSPGRVGGVGEVAGVTGVAAGARETGGAEAVGLS
ncbi:hypothetical protein [Streptomyces sp. NPDC056013]|uniref:hypothetical protein n=1 Tax=Streptomyces sp. NPDC056013 TaxID=3345680 RepID=UPI0035D650D2